MKSTGIQPILPDSEDNYPDPPVSILNLGALNDPSRDKLAKISGMVLAHPGLRLGRVIPMIAEANNTANNTSRSSRRSELLQEPGEVQKFSSEYPF